ncbi:MAG: DUF3021 family protein [Lachnospiraceae bacterium]|nr:DUF3021 family protein [Lachnospiraceae bacterium]MBQ2100395.1 DUF3021 family protein [Lachnospiraceae bacterium]MBQ3905977.1 DUF3021 family protein [Lachnospiraceae bacterium]
MLKETFERAAISFAIGSFAGLIVNFIIDIIAGALGAEGFCSISPDFQALFPTTAMAAYANVLLYGCISASFAAMTFVYEIERIGFLIQSIIYFAVTSTVCLLITMLLWQLQRYPAALFGTLAGYAVTHVIMITMAYKKLRKDVREINQELLPMT